MTTVNDTREIIKSLIAETCAIDRTEIQADGRLIAYGLDSVRAMDLIIAIEETTGVVIQPSDSVKLQTVSDVTSYVQRNRRTAS